MSKKLKKLKEVNKSIAKRCADLETYMFVENIVETTMIESKDDGNK